jgi:hypothetical protein
MNGALEIPEKLGWRPCHEAAIFGLCINAEEVFEDLSREARQGSEKAERRLPHTRNLIRRDS